MLAPDVGEGDKADGPSLMLEDAIGRPLVCQGPLQPEGVFG